MELKKYQPADANKKETKSQPKVSKVHTGRKIKIKWGGGGIEKAAKNTTSSPESETLRIAKAKITTSHYFQEYYTTVNTQQMPNIH